MFHIPLLQQYLMSIEFAAPDSHLYYSMLILPCAHCCLFYSLHDCQSDTPLCTSVTKASLFNRVGRHGKVFLTVRSPYSTAEEKFIKTGDAQGTDSLLDLDPEDTVFYFGGVPSGFKVRWRRNICYKQAPTRSGLGSVRMHSPKVRRKSIDINFFSVYLLLKNFIQSVIKFSSCFYSIVSTGAIRLSSSTLNFTALHRTM